MIWIGYTTHYREGSEKFARAARTLRDEFAGRPEQVPREIRVEALRSKADFVSAMQRIESAQQRIEQLHIIGHSGMYGIMFGSTRWPEQLSPNEWRALHIPFAEGASAHFHACRTARWFAPFFARTFGVRAFGHQGYTTVSRRRDRFLFDGFGRVRRLYLISVPGRKTHGWFGAFRKYALRPPAAPMLACDPAPVSDTGYDAVTSHYDRAFSDIRVRRDEWRWLRSRLQAATSTPRPRVLDLGCGNGALLVALADQIARGVGVDLSAPMIERARERAARHSHLSFHTIGGPQLPFPDRAFDVVTSFLSFRYLDWDPILREIRRVLAPGGRLLVVDMVEKPASWRDTPLLARSLVQHLLRKFREPRFVRDVTMLTTHPAWQRMLEHNPIRAAHEYRWYLESRFPGRRLETLNVGRYVRLVAFDSGALEPGHPTPLSYP
jgi:ubiquinone/menaquinone biosynthesis C-methylase UbiE